MNILAILSTLYYLVSGFYLFFALLFLFFPKFIRRFLPSLFPLLDSFHPAPLTTSICLAIVGVVLYQVGHGLALHSLWEGLYPALVLSAWEVFLSLGFYLPRQKHLNAIGHFVVHMLLAVLILQIALFGSPL
jgi:hypothetical protein